MKKVKIALICHFSNQLVREKLNLFPVGHYFYQDFANWISNIINGLKGRNDVELFVIAPHNGMKYATQEFAIEGVHYSFFRSELPFPWRSLEARLFSQSKRGYPRNRKYVNAFLRKIQPDLINLIGAENAYYAIAALDVENVPIMLHLQTVYANPDRLKNTNNVDKQRWDVELDVFHKTPYIACTGRMYYDLVKGYEPNAIIFPRRWPTSKFPEIPNVNKTYDFVFFAHTLCKNKGFDNAIEAMGIMIKKHPNSRFLAVGSKDANWLQYETRIKELGIEKNLEIHLPFNDYIDLLQYVKQGRFALLPITMDVISGTIIEAMRMGMPVVTCRTSGTPSLNEKRETVLISDIGDSEGLSQNMLRLYECTELQEKLLKNAELYLRERDEENSHNIDIMVLQYKAVIDNYYKGIPIPRELLYNPDENINHRKQ